MSNDVLGPARPLFFMSYAKSGRRYGEPDRLVRQFFDDLSENVAQLVSTPLGSNPGFMDGSVTAGSRWAEELLAAVGTCQVFVALLSVPYANSRWCGMEWDAFTRRKAVRAQGSGAGSALVPVIWAPLPPTEMPAAVQAVQRFRPDGVPEDIAGTYEQQGIYGLMHHRNGDAYQAVVWQLAQHVARLSYAVRVDPGILREHELRNSFAEPYQ